MRRFTRNMVCLGLLVLFCLACDDPASIDEATAFASEETNPFVEDEGVDLEDKAIIGSRREVEPPPAQDIYRFAGGCYALRDEGGRWLSRTGPARQRYEFVARSRSQAASFYMKAADLGTFATATTHRPRSTPSSSSGSHGGHSRPTFPSS